MDDVTLPELTRRVDEQGRRFADYARKDIYERDMNEIRNDLGDIKSTVTWAARGVGGVFIAVIIDIIVRVVTSGALSG